MKEINDVRSTKLKMARRSFHNSSKVGCSNYSQRRMRSELPSFAKGTDSTSENPNMTYWNSYVIRTAIALFIIATFFLYGVMDQGKKNQMVSDVRYYTSSNSSMLKAYETYTSVDYKDAYKKAITYAKAIFK